jgi:hypothetical protein
MEQKTNDQILKEIEKKTQWGYRINFADLEGKPTGNPKSRHRCSRCGKRGYEKDMKLTGFTKRNNYKSWITWACNEWCL